MSQALPLISGAPDASERARRIRDARIRMYYGATPGQLVALIVAAALVYMLWGVVSSTVLAAWYGTYLVLAALRIIAYRAYRRSADASHPRWGTIATISAASTGVLWGAGGILLYAPGSLEYQLLVLVVFAWLGVSSVVALGSHLPAFFAYLPASLLPLAAMFLLEGDRVHLVLGILLCIFLVTLLFYARQHNRALNETLKLRFENVDLLAELARKKDEAERANVGKSKFLAAASHDLRQPLHSLSLFTAALDAEAQTPKARCVVTRIVESVEALQRMFDLLLDVSRLDAGVIRPAPRHFRLNDVLRVVINDFAPEAQAKGLALECDVGETVVVRSDPGLLERMLRNLVANAVRYTERGKIRIGCVSAGARWRIEVADTGIGIPPSQHRAVFEEFHQLGNPERDRTKGLGLGLAIVDRVARLLDHPIGLVSAPGAGSCFSLAVPKGDESAVARAAPAANRGFAPGGLAGLRVLVVDDEAAAREAMRLLLEQWGCEAILAGSEEEAIEALRNAPGEPDVVVADYRLRDGRSGEQAIERVWAHCGRRVPALIVTGDTAPERLREAKASGHQLVHKPVPAATLRAFLGYARRCAARPPAAAQLAAAAGAGVPEPAPKARSSRRSSRRT